MDGDARDVVERIEGSCQCNHGRIGFDDVDAYARVRRSKLPWPHGAAASDEEGVLS